ncbi:hypothetical protein LEMLEM_LOCUS4004 [Lemmus lemmus]
MLGLSNSLPALQSAARDCFGSGSTSQCGRTGWRLHGGNQSSRQAPLKSSSQRVARIAKPMDAPPPRGKPGTRVRQKRGEPREERRKREQLPLKHPDCAGSDRHFTSNRGKGMPLKFAFFLWVFRRFPSPNPARLQRPRAFSAWGFVGTALALSSRQRFSQSAEDVQTRFPGWILGDCWAVEPGELEGNVIKGYVRKRLLSLLVDWWASLADLEKDRYCFSLRMRSWECLCKYIHMMAFADYKLIGSCSSCPCALMSSNSTLESRFGCCCSPYRVVVLQGHVCSRLWGLGSTTAAGRSALTLLGAGPES